MRNAFSALTVRRHLLIDSLLLRTIVSTAPTATTTTLLHAATSVDISSAQVS